MSQDFIICRCPGEQSGRHRAGYDRERHEFFCVNCGLVGEDFSREIVRFNPDGHALASPSVVNHGLGTNLDSGDRELKSHFHRRETMRANGAELDQIAQDHFLSGAAPRFFNSNDNSDEDMVMELENALRATSRFSNDRIAADCATFRRQIQKENLEKRKKIRRELDDRLDRLGLRRQ